MEEEGTEGPREDTLAYGHENLGLSLWATTNHVIFDSQKYGSVYGGGGLFVSGPHLIERTRCKEVEGYREMSRGLNTAEMKSSPPPPPSGLVCWKETSS